LTEEALTYNQMSRLIEVHCLFAAVRSRLISIAPTVTAVSLMAGNTGLLLRRGFHPNLETAVGFLWIASDYALRQKSSYPIAAPRINAAGIVLGSLLLSAGGFHVGYVDWNRVRTPLGYIPGAAVVGFQNELRRSGQRLTASCFGIAKCLRAVLRHPYALSALLCSYGVGELMKALCMRMMRGLWPLAPLMEWGRFSYPCWTMGGQAGNLNALPMLRPQVKGSKPAHRSSSVMQN
jgi:hypothetical protein